jgi:hypothetical protein
MHADTPTHGTDPTTLATYTTQQPAGPAHRCCCDDDDDTTQYILFITTTLMHACTHTPARCTRTTDIPLRMTPFYSSDL